MVTGNYETQDEVLSQKLITTKVYCFSLIVNTVQSQDHFVSTVVVTLELYIIFYILKIVQDIGIYGV